MPRQAQPPPRNRQPQPSSLNAKLWRACVGGFVETPTLHSRVYYFPQGHFEHASSAPRNLSPRVLARPYVLCRVASVQFLADSLTDEVFTKLVLHPLVDYSSGAGPSHAADDNNPPSDDGAPEAGADDEKIESFAKILTPSDANNGGGFSVPRFCADSIFPPLNFKDETPTQTLVVTDMHGQVWEFRHIYRGTPRRHLLTTGWSKFVNNKKLVAGDSVVFMRNSRGENFVGVRRATRPAGGPPKWRLRSRPEEDGAEEEEEEAVAERDVFSRDGKGKLPTKVVAEAAELAAQNMPFEVVYYPKAGWSEFVVKSEVVDQAMSITWSPGIRVKMAVETEDSLRTTWFPGVVSAVTFKDNGKWRGSPWRMLQVVWDEPEVLQHAKWVSPWQVELASNTPALHSAFPPTKRFKAGDGSGVFTEGEGSPFSMTEFTNSAMGHLNPTLLGYGTYPAGMQGARHDAFSASRFSNHPRDMSRLCMGISFGNNNSVPMLKTLSTELNVGSSQSDELSPDSRSSLHSCETEFVGNHNYNTRKPASISFQLFGAVIQTEQPDENGLDGNDCTGDGDQCQRASRVEACYL